MSETFPIHFLQLALAVTGAERGMAVDRDLTVLHTVNLPEDPTQEADFVGFENIRQAYDTDERPHITNNVILDSQAAPNTNTNFANLRLVVVFPLDELGAVYIDKHVSQGVIVQEDAERLMRLAAHLIRKERLDINPDDLHALYQDTCAPDSSV